MSGYQRTQEQEMHQAYEQKRQPNCVRCSHPLEKVMQPQDVIIVERWNQAPRKYVKSGKVSAERPYHCCYRCQDTCRVEDCGYIDHRSIRY